MVTSGWSSSGSPEWMAFPWHWVLGGVGLALLITHGHHIAVGVILLVVALAMSRRRRRWAMATGGGGWQPGWAQTFANGASTNGLADTARRGCGWAFGGGWGQRQPPASGNSAFDDYRAEMLRRLEDDQKEFSAFLNRLRQARDKAEFDQFMAERDRRPPPQAVPEHG